MNWDPISYVQKGIGWMNDTYRRWTGGGTDSWYVGNDGIYVGNAADQRMGAPTTQTKQFTGGNAGKYKPAGYSRSAAATAKDIAQGGMTKDEVIEFNMKHPNETAQRSE